MSISTDSVKPSRTRRVAAVVWKEVIAALVKDRERKSGWDVERSSVTSYVPALERFRTDGFSPDDFARNRSAREAMLSFLTRAEDDLEIASKPIANGDETRRFRRHTDLDEERAVIRIIRRRLEVELAS